MSKKNTINEKKYLDLNGLTVFLSKLEGKFVSKQNTDTYLKYVSQTLTNDQKLQVATNIGNNTMLSGHLIKYNENGTITSNGFINENLLYVLPNSALSESENADIFATKNSLKTINGESILGSGDIEVGEGKEPFYFEISDIDNLTNSCFDFSDLISAFKSERPIFLRFDTTQILKDRYIVPVSIVYNEYFLTLSFIYHDTIYKIDYEVNEGGNMYCSTNQTVTMIPIDRIYTKPGAGIPKSDLSTSVQNSLDNAIFRELYGDLEFIEVQGFNGPVSDILYALPHDATGDEDDIIATKNTLKTINGESIVGSGDITISGGTSDANVQAVDTGDIIDDVNVEYATTTYVDGLVGDINSVLESIINS